MASNQKLYLVMPNWTTPPNTSIRLGDIILDPTNAAYSRVTRESEEFRHCKEGHDESGVLNPDLPTISTEIATPWISYAEKYSSRSASADETHQENTKAGLQRFTCDELEMQVLNKPQDCIKKRAAAASVRKKMKPFWGLQRKSVYMVTGILIARGFNVDGPTSIEHELGAELNLKVRIPGLRIMDVSAGVNKLWGSSTEVIRSKMDGPLVFAFKLEEITLKVFHNDVSIDSYTKGAEFSGISLGESFNQKSAMTKGQIEVTKENTHDIEGVEATGLETEDVEATGKEIEKSEDVEDVEKKTEDLEEKTKHLENVEITPLSTEDLREILN